MADFSRGSTLFNIFTEFWKLFQKYWDMHGTENEWKSLTLDCKAFSQKYEKEQPELSTWLAYALFKTMQERLKNGNM